MPTKPSIEWDVRCGRCGLWYDYPEGHAEKKWAGTCLWFGFRLSEDEVFAERRCDQFFERLPGTDALKNLDYKMKRDDVGRIYRSNRMATVFSLVALALSILGLVSRFVS